MRLNGIVGIAGLALILSCASAGTPAASTGRTEISAEDIQKSGVATAYDAVDRLARRWFRDLSSGASGEVQVYLHTNQKLGGPSSLQAIPAADVVRLSYLKSSDAIGRFGQEASGGAIVVTRR